jgi:Fe-S-cluster containining protein
MQQAVRSERDSEVPCGGCTACCSSAQFIHIAPDEHDTLVHIPDDLLFPAPRMPPGHVLMGYDEHGACPMLVDETCTIYEHRPRTCRTYDCRVLPAAGLALTAADAKPLIATQAARWRFSYPATIDEVRHAAVRAAAAYLVDHRAELPAEAIPPTTTDRAVAAVMLHDTFLDAADRIREPSPNEVHVALSTRRQSR